MKTTIQLGQLPYWQQQVVSAIYSLEKAVAIVPPNRPYFSKKVLWALRPVLPYVLSETGINGKHILLNRDYNPIGIHYKSMDGYKSYPFMHIDQSYLQLFPESYEYHQQSNNIDGRFFSDSCAPWGSRNNAEGLLKRYKKLLNNLQGGSVI
jgi:hypothetical protein